MAPFILNVWFALARPRRQRFPFVNHRPRPRARSQRFFIIGPALASDSRKLPPDFSCSRLSRELDMDEVDDMDNMDLKGRPNGLIFVHRCETCFKDNSSLSVPKPLAHCAPDPYNPGLHEC